MNATASKKWINYALILYPMCGLLSTLVLTNDSLVSLYATEYLLRIPTVATLQKHGTLGEDIVTYFLVMIGLFPVIVLALFHMYEGREWRGMSLQRHVATVIFFLFSILLLSYFCFLLRPAHDYPGTRIKLLIYAASNSKLGLGIIFGAIFDSAALVTMLLVRYLIGLFDQKTV